MEASLDETPPPDAPVARARTAPILAGLLVFALVVAALFAFLWATKEDPLTSAEVETYLDARKEVVGDRAVEVMSLMLNYDSTNIAEVAEQVTELSTGEFERKYSALAGGSNLERALQEAAASSRGQINGDPDVAFRTPDEAIVILTMTQIAQSKSNPAGSTTDYVMRVTMLRVGDEWKADGVDVLSEKAI